MRRRLLRPRTGIAFAAAFALVVMLGAAALGGRSSGAAPAHTVASVAATLCGDTPSAGCASAPTTAPVEQLSADLPRWQDPLVQQGPADSEPMLDADTHNSDTPKRVDAGALILAAHSVTAANEPAPDQPAYDAAPDPGSGALFSWPVRGVITSMFGPAHPLGIDIGAESGRPVLAAADGRVALVQNDDPGYGNFVVLNHSNGYSTLYAHFERPAEVRAGDIVRRGQLLGYVGSTGHSTGPHLHFEVRLFDQVLNPLLVLSLGQLSVAAGAYEPAAFTPTPTATATATTTPTATPTTTPTATATTTPTSTATASTTPIGAPTATPTASATAAATSTATPAAPGATPTASPTARPGAAGTLTPIASTAGMPALVPTATALPTATPLPLSAGTLTPAAAPVSVTPSPTPSPSPSVRPAPTINPTVAVPVTSAPLAAPTAPPITAPVTPPPVLVRPSAAPTTVPVPTVPSVALPGTLTPTVRR